MNTLSSHCLNGMGVIKQWQCYVDLNLYITGVWHYWKIDRSNLIFYLPNGKYNSNVKLTLSHVAIQSLRCAIPLVSGKIVKTHGHSINNCSDQYWYVDVCVRYFQNNIYWPWKTVNSDKSLIRMYCSYVNMSVLLRS